jgi:hypothetical protein
MQLPKMLPVRPAMSDHPAYNFILGSSGLQPQGCDPLRAALLCSGRAGFAACVARAVATGDICDGGINNCSHAC